MPVDHRGRPTAKEVPKVVTLWVQAAGQVTVVVNSKRHTHITVRHTISNRIDLPRAVETIWPRPLAESPCQVPNSRSANRVVSLLPRLIRTAAKSVLRVPRRSSAGLYLCVSLK